MTSVCKMDYTSATVRQIISNTNNNIATVIYFSFSIFNSLLCIVYINCREEGDIFLYFMYSIGLQ